ncbi:hypothetical protein AB1Y20_017090 [Prymnesium parvum]|uniref:Mannosyltransferase n=1 Tax=Prymnesium parvum TaxID=97485 RepID=A0AB34I9Z0_PRYPA
MGAVKFYFLSALVVAALSSGSYYCYKHVGLPDWYWQARLPPEVAQLDVSDTATLKKVLFSGEPWLLQCYSGLPFEGQHLPRPYRTHDVFTQSLPQLRGLVRAGVLDCEAPLPSNKSLAAKFHLVRRTQPLLLLASGGDRPKQLPAAAVGSAYGVAAWVTPKAAPAVRAVASDKALGALCGGRRPCLLARLPRDAPVLAALARDFRTVEVVSAGEEGGRVAVAWGRGAEVGETLEEDEQKHFGARVTLIRPDPTAPPTRKGARPAPRIIRGFAGEEDYPSLARFIKQGLEASPDDTNQVRAQLPSIRAEKVKKAAPTDNAEVQARRAKKRAEARAKEEAERAARAEVESKQSEEMRRRREQRRREQMAAEEEEASNVVEEEEEEEEEEDVAQEEDDEGMEALDLDA